jgi:NtrC-family two-component system sensor histidine kinase KinB
MTAASRLGLRARFLFACGLLVLTTVAASLWTLGVLARLAASAHALVQKSDEASNALEETASSLERENDALLVVLGSDDHSQANLPAAQLRVDQALHTLTRILDQGGAPQLAEEATARIAAYRLAVKKLLSEPLEKDPLDQYHRDLNPPLRLASATLSRIRDRFFFDMVQGLTNSRDAVSRTRSMVLLIAAAALLVAVGVALRLSREIIVPLRQLTQGANAIREGHFEARIPGGRRDEIAEVVEAFNHMAERLTEFRRVNLEEVLRVKGTLEATLTALPDAVVLFGADGHVLSLNPAAAALLTVGKPARSLREQEAELAARGLIPDALRAVIAGAVVPPSAVNLSSVLRCEVRGETHLLLPRIAKTAREPDGRCGAVLVLSDVTELARLDELRAEHIAVASHELRTPVTTLRMTLLLLTEASAGLPVRVRDLVSTAWGGVEQLGETVDELLDLARIEAGRLKLLSEPLDVAALLREMVTRAAVRAEDAGVKLYIDGKTDSALPKVRGDRARLRIVLDNLINNALKYTPFGGQAALSVQSLGAGSVRIVVRDTGPGIPVELRGRVFEKFFRIESHRSSASGGSYGAGIGLFLCKQIVELHAGRIFCEPGEDGLGTRMIIDLPTGMTSIPTTDDSSIAA